MQIRTPRPFLAAIAAALLSMAMGCGGQMGDPDPAATARPGDGVYDIRGVVVATDVGNRILEINHEDIPGFMAAMTMPYEVADATLLQGLVKGDRVRGTLRVDRRGYVITALEKF